MLLAAYSKEVFLKMSDFPNRIHPDENWVETDYKNRTEFLLHRYLINDGWTYSFEEAKETLLACGYIDIAAVYKTPNNSKDTIAWIEIESDGNTIGLGGVSGTIDWGDGTITNENKENSSATHTYSKSGYYVVKISPSSQTNIGYYECKNISSGYSFMRYVTTNSYSFGYGDPYIDIPGLSVTCYAIYTGHAIFQPGAFYSSYIR